MEVRSASLLVILAGSGLGIFLVLILCMLVMMQKKHLAWFHKNDDVFAVEYHNEERDNFLSRDITTDENGNVYLYSFRLSNYLGNNGIDWHSIYERYKMGGKYQTVRTLRKSSQTIVKTGKIDTTITHIITTHSPGLV